LIDKNGKNLRECVIKCARNWGFDEEFISWVENENVFCNTLVDRINTGYPKDENIESDDKMLNTSEYFHLWVVEGYDKLFDEIPFDKANLNVIVTNELEKYRTRKVRILNGAHTSMIPYALLSGLETVKDCLEDEKMSAFLRRCVFEEIMPTLDLPKEELEAYASSVMERFANPYIKHYCSSIALNSVSKFKVRVLPSLEEYIVRFGKMPENLLFSFAQLIKFYRTDMTNDAADVTTFMKTATIEEILANETLWDKDLSYLVEGVKKYVD
jgi:tagaturonate reductase